MSVEDTDEAFLAIKQMRKLVDEFIQAGGKITHLPAYKCSPPNNLVVEPTKRGRGRPPKIVETPLLKRTPGRPKVVKSV